MVLLMLLVGVMFCRVIVFVGMVMFVFEGMVVVVLEMVCSVLGVKGKVLVMIRLGVGIVLFGIMMVRWKVMILLIVRLFNELEF